MVLKNTLEAILDLVRSAWRFRWSALLFASVVGALGVFAALVIPGKYEAHAQIYVDTRSVLKPLLQGLAVTNQAPDETDVVRRALLARPNLDRVARNIGIYARAGTPEGVEQLLSELTRLIDIHGDSSTGLYTISYQDPDPRKAHALVQNLLDTFLENSIGEGRTDTQNAEAFLAQQVSEYEQRLSQSEQRLADFKKYNVGLMPDQRGDYFVRLQTELATRDKLRTDLAVAAKQREELQSKLTDNGLGTPEGGSAPTGEEIRAAEALDARIAEARNTLSMLLEKFTEQHPRVIDQREMIRQLEERRQAEVGMVRKTNAAQTADSRIAFDPVVQNLQIALNNADVQVTALQAELGRSEAKVAELQRMVTTGPQVEAELARLNRDYGVTKTEYEALLQRLESARISHDADRSEELRFKVLEPARVPIRPAKPNRPLLIAAVLLASIGAGVALAMLRAQMQPVFISKTSLSALKLPVVGTVSRAPTARQRALQRGEYLVYGSAAAILLAIIIFAAVFSFSASSALRQIIGVGQG